MIKEIRPMGEETIYAYDGAGNLIRKLDAKNQKTMYVYDDAGRLTEVDYFSSTEDVTPVKTVSFTYDNLGNLMSYNDGTTSAQYQYDDAYRKLTETVDYGPFTKTFGYTYYKNGAKKTFTDPSGTTYTYSYDAANQLTAVQIPGQGSITFTSYTWNRPASVALPGGSRKDYVYDPLMRVKQITSRDPAQNVLINYQYTYDKMDNIITKDTEHGLYTYGYDALYRLTSADNPTLPDEAYTYDGVGNRLTSSDATDWTYNPNNELLSYNGITFAYDENGNTVQKTEGTETTYYIYNEEDRLARVEDTAHNLIAAYYYDPFGRRLWKEVAGTRTCFLYSDEGLIGEYTADGTETKTYGYKPNSTWTTDPIFLKTQGTYYFYHNDHLGIPQMMTTNSGAVVRKDKCSSFGKAIADSNSTVVSSLRFPGQYEDAETGLHYNRYRYYDAEIGRYLKVDPSRLSQLRLLSQIHFNDFLNAFPSDINKKADRILSIHFLYKYRTGSPLWHNNYFYAADNPFFYLDPDGKNPFGIIIGIAAGAYGGWVSGMQSGDMTTAIISGVAGGVAGGLVGVIFPNLSATAGGIISGFVGGFSGGITGEAIADDSCDTFADYADAAVIGGVAGMISGGISGSIAAGVIYVGAPAIIGEIAGAIASAPVSIGLGLVQGALLN